MRVIFALNFFKCLVDSLDYTGKSFRDHGVFDFVIKNEETVQHLIKCDAKFNLDFLRLGLEIWNCDHTCG